MAAITKMRVRLDLTEFSSNIPGKSPLHSFYWFFIDTTTVSNIVQFKAEVKRRYECLTGTDFTLVLDNAVIHDFETIDVLRDGDTIKLVPHSIDKLPKKRNKKWVSVEVIEPQAIPVVYANKTNGADSGDFSEKKRKKHKHHHKKEKESDKLSSSNCDTPINVVTEETPNIKTPEKVNEAKGDDQSVECCSEVSFQEEIVEPQKKRRRGKRKRKSKEPKIDYFFDPPPVIEIDCPRSTPKEEVEDEDANSSRKHIRFDAKSSQSPKKVFGMGFMKFDNGFQEMSKDRQVDSKLVNKSVILLNCGNTEPSVINDALNESKPSTLQSRIDDSGAPNYKFSNYSQRNETKFRGDDTLDQSALSLHNESLESGLEENADVPNKFKVQLRTPVLRFNENKSVVANVQNVESTSTEQQAVWVRSNALLKEATQRDSPIRFDKNVCEKVETSENTTGNNETPSQKNWTALVGPPRVGDLIAYKVLELGENYCPEVSKYKTAKVVGFRVKDDCVELENLSEANRKLSFGKFDIVNEEEDESPPSPEKFVSIKLNDLIEAKLINSLP